MTGPRKSEYHEQTVSLCAASCKAEYKTDASHMVTCLQLSIWISDSGAVDVLSARQPDWRGWLTVPAPVRRPRWMPTLNRLWQRCDRAPTSRNYSRPL